MTERYPQELAERRRLTVRTISNLERGQTRWPYRDSVYRLADALGLRDTPRPRFIAAADRRLDAAAPPDGPGAVDRDSDGEDRGQGVPRLLPAPVPGFVGRDAQLAALSRVLHQPGRTAVITAIGGTAWVGKTALAVHWAHQVVSRFPDGQLYVNLRGYDAAPPMPATDALARFLRALGVPGNDIPAEADERAARYRSLMAGRRMLLVLDNAREVEQIRPLLPGNPTCVTVVTSRDSLAGAGGQGRRRAAGAGSDAAAGRGRLAAAKPASPRAPATPSARNRPPTFIPTIPNQLRPLATVPGPASMPGSSRLGLHASALIPGPWCLGRIHREPRTTQQALHKGCIRTTPGGPR